MIINVTTN